MHGPASTMNTISQNTHPAASIFHHAFFDTAALPSEWIPSSHQT
jgi:hypothetical protein